MIKLIAAMDQKGLIGVNNSIPWHYSEDFIRFRKITTNHILIMGQNTVVSLPNKLKNRTVIGIGNIDLPFADFVVKSFRKAIKKAITINGEAFLKGQCDVWICGGGFVYNQALDMPYVNHLDITIVPQYNLKETDKDLVYFPKEKLNNYYLMDETINPNNPNIKHRSYRRKL